MLWETKETAAIVALIDLPHRQFAYAVENGTIGVYETGQRLWRVKVNSFYTQKEKLRFIKVIQQETHEIYILVKA